MRWGCLSGAVQMGRGGVRGFVHGIGRWEAMTGGEGAHLCTPQHVLRRGGRPGGILGLQGERGFSSAPKGKEHVASGEGTRAWLYRPARRVVGRLKGSVCGHSKVQGINGAEYGGTARQEARTKEASGSQKGGEELGWGWRARVKGALRRSREGGTAGWVHGTDAQGYTSSVGCGAGRSLCWRAGAAPTACAGSAG
jgi:hypothetical protein